MTDLDLMEEEQTFYIAQHLWRRYDWVQARGHYSSMPHILMDETRRLAIDLSRPFASNVEARKAADRCTRAGGIFRVVTI